MPALVTGIAGVLTAFKATAIGTWLTGTFTGRLLASVALSALQGALIGQPADAGFASQYTATGGTNPCSFIVGFSATAGQEICPPMTHGKAGKTPNAYLTYVIKLGDIPGQTLQGIQIDGAPVTLGSTPHADYGLPVTGRYAGYAWFKYYNGSQTVADPMLLAKYGTYPERPWLADMIGINMCYVIMTFRYNRELFGGLPQGLWECGSIPLYDPRKDTTVGGSGAHRWATPATWEPTVNPQVINYNIARGVTLPGLGIWGGDFAAEDLPLGNWFTAMNECDVLTDTPATAQFRAGYEIRVIMEPAGVMDEMNRASTGQFAETGGVLKVRVGGPGLPVLFITDGDIIVSKPQDYQPFPNAAGRQNGIEARYPDPSQVWQPIAAPPLYNATWEAEDGARRTTSLDLRACPYPKQCTRVMKSYITDARRNRSHGQTLPPDAAILEPLDVYGWTSVANTYTIKLFEVSQIADDLFSILQQVSIRECDPADFVPPTGLVVPTPVSSAPAIPVAQTLPGWAVSGYIIADGASVARVPGGIGIWDGAELDDATGVQYQVRVAATGQVIEEGFVSNVEAGRVVASKGILRNTGYEMRALLVVEGRASNWTVWTYFLSPNIASVTAAEIGPGAVAYGNLVAPQTGVGLFYDKFCSDLTAWQGTGLSIVADATAPGGSSIRSSAVTATQLSQRFAINSLRDHVAEVWIKQVSGTSTAYLLVSFEDENGVNLDGSSLGASGWFSYGSYAYFGLIDQIPPAIYTKYSIPFGPNEVAKIPTAARYARIGWLSNYTGGAGTQAVGYADIYERVGSGQIVNNAVLSQHTQLVPGNMVSNPSFATGDFTDWRPWAATADANQKVVPRATAGVPANAPTANVVRYSFGPGSVTQIATFAGAQAYNDPRAADSAIPTIADQSYRMTIDAAKSAGGTFIDFNVLMFYLMADGSYGSYTAPIAVGSLSTSFQTLTGVYTAPAGSVGVWPFIFANMTGTGEMYWTKLTMDRMATGDLINPGAVHPVHFAAGVTGIERLAVLPATGNFVGRVVMLTTNNKLYRHTGTPIDDTGFTAAADGADLLAASVTANEMNVASLSAISADVGTLTAGVLQSPNYVALTSGSMINLTTGDAEFNDLVVRGDMILLGAVTTEILAAGAARVKNMLIEEVLFINSGTGALSVGKTSAFDLANDGAFFGRTVEAGGGYGYGFNVGRKVGGVDQYIQGTSQTGLSLVNANHYVTGLGGAGTVSVTASQTVTLPVGTKQLTLDILGAGSGGVGASNSSGTPGANGAAGGQTLVQLFDGATNTGVSWASAGGLAGTGFHPADSGYAGQNSSLGTGGAGGLGTASSSTGNPGGAATGYGAGGGGGGGTELGGNGGKASSIVSISDYNLTALTNPKLVITIGTAGTGGAGFANGGNGGNGSPGIVKYQAKLNALVPASVLPMQPTFTGTISKTSGGVLTFPNFGAGFWELSAQGTTGLLLDYVETHLAGERVRLSQGNYAAFISDKTPVDVASSATAVTYDYRYTRLGPWI